MVKRVSKHMPKHVPKRRYLDLLLMHAPVALAHTGIPPSTTTPRDGNGDVVASGVPHAETWGTLP